MATYSAVTAGEKDADSPINVGLIDKLDQNPHAIAEGASGAPKIQTAAYGAGSVDRTAITTDTTSNSTNSDTVQTYVVTGGGYAFQNEYRISSQTDSGSRTASYEGTRSVTFSNWSLTNVCYQMIEGQTDTVSRTMYVDTIFIDASPPYDLGDGEVKAFIFVHMNSLGQIISVSSSKTPPWVHNGPTKATPDYCENTPDGLKKYKYECTVNEETGIIEKVPVEITQAVKNADMDYLPHPFCTVAPSDNIVMIDCMDTEYLADLMSAGISVNELLHNDYLRVKNDRVSRKGPKNLMQCGFTWKNSKSRAGQAVKDKREKRGPYA
ncbi:MAG: hypothetical protein EBV86_01970 [Marivivens sp.]|nr:hypothetical protein [Marivivens sp.]